MNRLFFRAWFVGLLSLMFVCLAATPSEAQCSLQISAYVDGAVTGYYENGNAELAGWGSFSDDSSCDTTSHQYGSEISVTRASDNHVVVLDLGYETSVEVTAETHYIDLIPWVYCPQLPGVASAQARRTINIPPRPPCNDERTVIRQEYVDASHPFTPGCDDFTQSVPYPSHYGFSVWNQDGDYNWAILRENMVANVWCIATNYGEARPLTSGYRNPVSNAHTTPSGSFTGRHTYGDAADLDTPNSPDDTMYNELRSLAKQSTCGSACVEPRNIAPGHVHVDYRGNCPASW